MKDRKHKRFCSKHQCVHGEHTKYWSCRFPNDKKFKLIKHNSIEQLSGTPCNNLEVELMLMCK